MPSQLDEEDYKEIMDMTAALNVYDAFGEWKRRKPGKEAEFKAQHPGSWDIVMGLIKEL